MVEFSTFGARDLDLETGHAA